MFQTTNQYIYIIYIPLFPGRDPNCNWLQKVHTVFQASHFKSWSWTWRVKLGGYSAHELSISSPNSSSVCPNFANKRCGGTHWRPIASECRTKPSWVASKFVWKKWGLKGLYTSVCHIMKVRVFPVKSLQKSSISVAFQLFLAMFDERRSPAIAYWRSTGLTKEYGWNLLYSWET